MSNKIEKLNELGQLYKSGALTKDEFENLKAEILNGSNISEDDKQSETKSLALEQKVGKEKISLKSFTDNENIRTNPPQIEYLNFKDIGNDELKLLKPFIRGKQIHAPSEMTADEINIGNKIFSVQEIAEINSERPGFNYAFGSIISVLCSGAALYFISISPCFIILGAGTGLISALFISLTILNKVDSTKLDKAFCFIALTLGVIAIITYFKWS
jgi:hypothetical protein